MRFAQLSRNHACARCLHPCPRCDACAAVKARRHTLLRTSPPLRTKPHDQKQLTSTTAEIRISWACAAEALQAFAFPLSFNSYQRTPLARDTTVTMADATCMRRYASAAGDRRRRPCDGGSFRRARMRAAVACGVRAPMWVQRNVLRVEACARAALTAAHCVAASAGGPGERKPALERGGCRGCSLQHPLPAGGITKSRGIKRAGVSS